MDLLHSDALSKEYFSLISAIKQWAGYHIELFFLCDHQCDIGESWSYKCPSCDLMIPFVFIEIDHFVDFQMNTFVIQRQNVVAVAGAAAGVWEVCCPDSFYLCIAQVVRAGAAISAHRKITGVMTDDHVLRDTERIIEVFQDCQVRMKNKTATTAPADLTWTLNCPT